jgi:hypothetical protein
MTNMSEDEQMNKTKKLELLIIEDKERHLADAETYFGERTEIVNANYATTLDEAEQAMQEKKYDGIVTDIFFPIGKAEAENARLTQELASILESYTTGRAEGVRQKFREWSQGEALAPSGVYVVLAALEKAIPVIINTDQHHHSRALSPIDDWIYDAPNQNGTTVPMIENGERDDYDPTVQPAEQKEWSKAYAGIVSIIRGEKYHEMLHVKGDEERLQKLQQLITCARETGKTEVQTYFCDSIFQTFEKAEEEMKQLEKQIEEKKALRQKYLV